MNYLKTKYSPGDVDLGFYAVLEDDVVHKFAARRLPGALKIRVVDSVGSGCFGRFQVLI